MDPRKAKSLWCAISHSTPHHHLTRTPGHLRVGGLAVPRSRDIHHRRLPPREQFACIHSFPPLITHPRIAENLRLHLQRRPRRLLHNRPARQIHHRPPRGQEHLGHQLLVRARAAPWLYLLRGLILVLRCIARTICRYSVHPFSRTLTVRSPNAIWRSGKRTRARADCTRTPIPSNTSSATRAIIVSVRRSSWVPRFLWSRERRNVLKYTPLSHRPHFRPILPNLSRHPVG